MRQSLTTLVRLAVVASLLFVFAGTGRADSPVADGWNHQEVQIPYGFRSLNSNRPVKMVIQNRTHRSLELVWVDFNGQEQAMGRMQPHEEQVFDSYATHAWLFKSHGRVVDYKVLNGRPEQYVVVGNSQPDPAPNPTPFGQGDTIRLRNRTDVAIQLVTVTRRGNRNYTTIQPGQLESITIRPWEKATQIQIGRHMTLNLPEVSDGMRLLVSGDRFSARLTWRQDENVQPPGQPAFAQALGIQVRELGRDRWLVVDAGFGLGSRVLRAGDVITGTAGIGRQPEFPGGPYPPGMLLTELRVETNSGRELIVDVRRQLGDVVVLNG
ncbi:MAG: hypothetical protein KDA60_15845 [Planctomycetales bacterium]|nr:hypothetical protein [Planctomycetales bacterium]